MRRYLRGATLESGHRGDTAAGGGLGLRQSHDGGADRGDRVAAPDLHDAVLVIHDYIEGFHEGLEEGFVFPRLRREPAVAGTVTTLPVQHARGRVPTQFLQVGPFLPGTLTARPAGRVAGLSRADGFACRRQNVVMAQYGRAGSKG
jgi:hypothetical protein